MGSPAEKDARKGQEILVAQTVLAVHGLATHDVAGFRAIQRESISDGELEAGLLNLGAHAQVNFIEKEATRLLYVKKYFGLDIPYPATEASSLLYDSFVYADQLRGLGVNHVVRNYEPAIKVDETTQTASFSVDQLYLPYGTVLDWLRNNTGVEEVTRTLITDCLVPVLNQPHVAGLKETDAFVSFDTSLNNFIYIPGSGIFCFDFFPPRLRTEDRKVKSYGEEVDKRLDKEDPEEVYYRRFTRPGMIHNFLKRAYDRILGKDNAIDPSLGDEALEKVNLERLIVWGMFCQIADELLGPYLQRYFPDDKDGYVHADKLARTEFKVYQGKF